MRGTELRGARATTTCVYPRDDVNTSHESTRLLGRDGRAAQLGCSRSSLVTRSNSAQVVLLCGECGMRASTYDLSLSLYLPLPPSLSPYLSALLVFSALLSPFFSSPSLYATVFTPSRGCRVSFPSLSYLSFSFYFLFFLRRQQSSYILPSCLTN